MWLRAILFEILQFEEWNIFPTPLPYFFNREALARQLDNALGSVCLSVRLSVCLLARQKQREKKSHYQPKVFVCVSSNRADAVDRLLIFFIHCRVPARWGLQQTTWAPDSDQLSTSYLQKNIKRTDCTFDPFLLRQGEPGTSQYYFVSIPTLPGSQMEWPLLNTLRELSYVRPVKC